METSRFVCTVVLKGKDNKPFKKVLVKVCETHRQAKDSLKKEFGEQLICSQVRNDSEDSEPRKDSRFAAEFMESYSNLSATPVLD